MRNAASAPLFQSSLALETGQKPRIPPDMVAACIKTLAGLRTRMTLLDKDPDKISEGGKRNESRKNRSRSYLCKGSG
jgi:hypothetical protein